MSITDKKEIYILDYRLKWETFKKLYDAVQDSGPSPMELPKVLWKMMRKRTIIIGVDTGINDFIFWTAKPPKGLRIIKNA